MDEKKQKLRDTVRKKYARVITEKSGCGCGTMSGCCGTSQSAATKAVTGNLYSAEDIDGLSADLLSTSLGCGNPTALSSLHAGETVLDLGSGAGLDVLLSARRVGQSGKAYGLDMTDEMLAAANANKISSGATNVEFLKGHIEDIPLPNGSVDVVISNCVINLSADKDAVFREIFRVLKPGGRMAVSDIVLRKHLPDKIAKDIAAWAGCVAGALHENDYRQKLKDAGFPDVNLEITRVYDPKDLGLNPTDIEEALVSAFIRAKKPSRRLDPTSDYTVRSAALSDFPTIHNLLLSSALPVDGVDPEKGTFLVAENTGALLGVIGFERYETKALLRSMAVNPAFRKSGIAKELVQCAIRLLHAEGIFELYLLTATAEEYARKFGFVTIPRSEMPAIILERSLLGCACPATSACMKLSR